MSPKELKQHPPCGLELSNAQWSRRHAAFFKTGSVTFVGKRERGVW
jgi:hypothetical protein